MYIRLKFSVFLYWHLAKIPLREGFLNLKRDGLDQRLHMRIHFRFVVLVLSRLVPGQFLRRLLVIIWFVIYRLMTTAAVVEAYLGRRSVRIKLFTNCLL